MEWLKLLLRVAGLALPAPYRRRWLEETLAVLYDVHGWRRWRYAVDTALKAPLLAREYQRAPLLPPRWLTALAGAALVVAPVIAFCGLYFGDVAGVPPLAGAMLMALGVLPTVAGRSFHLAARRGGGVRFIGAALLSSAVVLGPVVTVRAALVQRADVTVVGMSFLGAWLVWVNLAILRRRAGASDQAVLGVMSGVPLLVLPVVALFGLDGWKGMFVFFSMPLTLPMLGTWCLLAGFRMLAGRPDLMPASDAGGADRGVEIGG
jgi:hypothetical protein